MKEDWREVRACPQCIEQTGNGGKVGQVQREQLVEPKRFLLRGACRSQEIKNRKPGQQRRPMPLHPAFESSQRCRTARVSKRSLRAKRKPPNAPAIIPHVPGSGTAALARSSAFSTSARF